MARNWKIICCPVDFSEPTRAALGVAADLCGRLGSSLILLHVDGHRKVSDELPGGESVDASLAAWKAEAERMGAPNVAVEHAYGEAELSIVHYAARNGVDLLVLGTHARTDREKMLAGSVTESVVRTARCPVLTVHPDDAR